LLEAVLAEWGRKPPQAAPAAVGAPVGNPKRTSTKTAAAKKPAAVAATAAPKKTAAKKKKDDA